MPGRPAQGWKGLDHFLICALLGRLNKHTLSDMTLRKAWFLNATLIASRINLLYLDISPWQPGPSKRWERPG